MTSISLLYGTILSCPPKVRIYSPMSPFPRPVLHCIYYIASFCVVRRCKYIVLCRLLSLPYPSTPGYISYDIILCPPKVQIYSPVPPSLPPVPPGISLYTTSSYDIILCPPKVRIYNPVPPSLPPVSPGIYYMALICRVLRRCKYIVQCHLLLAPTPGYISYDIILYPPKMQIYSPVPPSLPPVTPPPGYILYDIILCPLKARIYRQVPSSLPRTSGYISYDIILCPPKVRIYSPVPPSPPPCQGFIHYIALFCVLRRCEYIVQCRLLSLPYPRVPEIYYQHRPHPVRQGSVVPHPVEVRVVKQQALSPTPRPGSVTHGQSTGRGGQQTYSKRENIEVHFYVSIDI